jgi:hemerythrin-like domain-containing protein
VAACHVNLDRHLDRPTVTAPGPATADLRRDHEVILRALAVLERVGDRLASSRPASDSTLIDLAVLLRTFADRCHHGKEEGQLFPAMQAKGAGGVLAPFLEEHEQGRAYLSTLASSAPAPERVKAARRYVGMLRDHIQREDEVLFPMADGLFTAEEHAALGRAYEDVERRVVGPGIHERLLATLAGLEAAIPATGAGS